VQFPGEFLFPTVGHSERGEESAVAWNREKQTARVKSRRSD
jgi:hypothetical protein